MDAPTPHPQSPTPSPQYIGVDCRVCGTRLYGLPEHVGKRLKCPDCGAATVLPTPPKVSPKKPPSALEGEQYEVWGVDEQPLPSELAAGQPKYMAVKCRLCDTPMHATEAQVGRTLICPDCGTRNVVRPPRQPKPAKPVVDDETYEVDVTKDPGERPPVLVTPGRELLYEEEESAERGKAASAKPKKRPKARTDVRGRPIMPRFPLLTGVLPFIVSRGTPVRWLVLSLTFLPGAWLFAYSLSSINQSLGAGSVGGGGMGAIMGVCFMVLAVIAGVMWASAAASVCLTVVTESAEGHDQIQHWPPANLMEWFPDLFYLLIALPVSGFPGWLIGRLATTDPTQQALWIVGSVWMYLPLALLSQLEVDSPWAVMSARLLGALLRRPFSWLLFYVESAVLAAACVAAAIGTAAVSPNLVLLLAPVYVAAGLLYSRLLGRLGWRIAADSESPKASEPPRAGQPLSGG